MGDQAHQSYIEANGVVYEFNFYDLPKAGATCSQLKDRSAGQVIRYNYILQAGHHLDLVEAQDGATVFLSLPGYRESFVYGNIFYMTKPLPAEENFIHYAYDGVPANSRDGVLYLYHNTFVIERDYNEAYRIVLLKLNGRNAVDFRNNIVVNKPVTALQTNPLLGLTYNGGTVISGVNWVSPHWANCRDGVGSCTSIVTGTERFYTPVSAWVDPGFADIAARNFSLLPTSTAIGRAGPLAPAVTSNSLGMDLTPVCQYAGTKAHTIRPGVRDLGAFERASLVIAPSSVVLSESQSQQFTIAQTAPDPAVLWSIAPAYGAINGAGLYVAPASISEVETITVLATSVSDPSGDPPPPSRLFRQYALACRP